MAKLTQEEFVKRVKESREAYIQAAVGYMDALERLDFETAMKHAMDAPNILGMDVMEYLMNWYIDADTEEFDKKYEEVSEKLLESIELTDEEKRHEENERKRQEMVSNLTKMTLGD